MLWIACVLPGIILSKTTNPVFQSTIATIATVGVISFVFMMAQICLIVPATLALRLPEARVQQLIIVLPATEDVPIIVFTMVLGNITVYVTVVTHQLVKVAQQLTNAIQITAAANTIAFMMDVVFRTVHVMLVTYYLDQNAYFPFFARQMMIVRPLGTSVGTQMVTV